MLAARRALRLPHPAILCAIAGAWLLAIAAEVSGRGAALHHDSLIEGGPAFPVALVIFALAWQVMIVAMMLPSSLPAIRLFYRMATAQPRATSARTAFVGGYALVWTVFGIAAFTFDLGVHRTVDSWPWLSDRSWFIAGATLILAGAFQFSPLKDQCLTVCRHPAAFMLRYYRRGVGAALRTGIRHGMFCAGCCWALMLVAFAAGVANLVWMAAFTAVMIVERTWAEGDGITAPVGVALITIGALVFVHPVGLPPVFANG
jgi:predicted metal-binding membrane protein